MPEHARLEDKLSFRLEEFGLRGMDENFIYLSQKAMELNSPPLVFLEELVDCESLSREESRENRWFKLGRFPARKTLEEFDFSYQPSINPRQIFDLASCQFIDNKQNIIFFGPPGVGKTHLSIALGLRAIKEGYECRFLPVRELIENVKKMRHEEIIYGRRLFSSFLRPKLLILDEMDFYEMDKDASEFLFSLLQERYEKGSTIFTSNKKFHEWQSLFGDHKKAAAAVDRIAHHATIVEIDGKSYRIKDKLRDKGYLKMVKKKQIN